MNILDEQIETGGSLQFVQVSKLQTRMFPGFFFNLLMFPPSAGGATCPPYDLKSQKGQIEGIIRFYAASATCQGDKLKWTPTCQGTNCGARMFPGFLLNLSLFLSPALGQLGVGPLRPASGMTLSPAGSGAVCQWQTSSTDRRGSGDQALVPTGHQRPPKGEARLGAGAVRRLRGQPAHGAHVR